MGTRHGGHCCVWGLVLVAGLAIPAIARSAVMGDGATGPLAVGLRALAGQEPAVPVPPTGDGVEGGWLEVRDLSAEGEGFTPVPAPLRGGAFSGTARELAFKGTALGLAFEGTLAPLPGSTTEGAELHCTVRAEPPRDRAIVVRVSLPVQAIGWTWWDDTVQKRAIEAGKHYDRCFDWAGGRRVSVYPCCAVTGPEGGLALAVPLHEPRVYRFAYSADRERLEAEFDLGLSPDTAKFPARADFRLLAYRHDAKWGFRDALRLYYELFPQYAERRAKEGGIWLLGFEPERMACPWDFGFRFDEGAQGRAGYDCAHGILPFVYTEPWGKYEHFGARPTPDEKPRYGEKAPMLSPEELKARVTGDLAAPEGQRDGHFGPRRYVAQAIANSAIEKQDGGWVWRHWTDEWSPGDWISNVTLNPDPSLPEPNRASLTWKYELEPAYEAARRNGGELAGVYLDSVAGFMGFYNENFRRDHWRQADDPLVASPEARAPAQLHAFACHEFAQQVAERVRAEDGYVIANTFRPYMQFFCYLLDMIGTGETRSCGLAADEHYRYMRAYGYRKPLSWMDYGFVDPEKGWEEKERGLQRCLFYAVQPGTGGFPASAAYEPSRPLFRLYEPMITWLDEAGWQPVTWAWTSEDTVLLERYGPAAESGDVTFLALRNPGQHPVEVRVEIDPRALGTSFEQAASAAAGDGLVAWRLVGDEQVAITVARQVGRLRTGLSLAGDSTEVLALGSRPALAGLGLREAQRFLARMAEEALWLRESRTGRLGNADFEEGMQAWGTERPPAAREAEIALEEKTPLAGKASLVARSMADNAFQALHQNLVLPGGQSYRLGFRYRWIRPEGTSGAVVPRFGVKGPDGQWASDKYIYFRDLSPTGDKAATYKTQFTVPDQHSVGFFQFLFERNWGTAWVDDIEIAPLAPAEGKPGLEAVASAAREAAKAWDEPLSAADGQAGLALAASQEEVYRRLREAVIRLEGSADEAHVRRCLLLPLEDFADYLGRGVEVLTGVTLHVPSGKPFADAAKADRVSLAYRLTTARQAVTSLRVAAAGAPWGEPGGSLGIGETRRGQIQVALVHDDPWDWHDVMVEAGWDAGGRRLWLPRRATVRLHPAAELEAAGPLSSARQALALRLRSWVPPGREIRLSADAAVGERRVSLAPLTVTPGDDGLREMALAVPPELVALLPDAQATGGALRLLWRAETKGIAPTSGELEVPVVAGATCQRFPTAPGVDGVLQPGEWDSAARIDGFFGAQDGKPAARPTTVLLGHDAANLFLAVLCGGQPKPQAVQRAHDGPVWEDDAVEVFLQPGGAGGYYHLAVNAAGSRYDACCAPGIDKSWNAPWQAAARTAEAGWTVEMAIPFASLHARPEGAWRLNFGREEADTGSATCWSPTFDGFHTPGRFGEVVFR